MDYLDDYDPDEEEIFGSNLKVEPKRVIVTEKEKNDVLRRPKVVLASFLLAEKQPISAQRLMERMMQEDSKILDYESYGFNSMDEILQACPDTIIHRRLNDGTSVYMAKTNMATVDIADLVARQADDRKQTRPATFLKSTPSDKTIYGSCFRSSKGHRIPTAEEAEMKRQRVNAQIRARKSLRPLGTVGRIRDIAEFLIKHRSTVETSDPENPGRKAVTLARLQDAFENVYGVFIWKKRMNERDLRKALDTEEYKGYLTFREYNNFIFVDIDPNFENIPSEPQSTELAANLSKGNQSSTSFNSSKDQTTILPMDPAIEQSYFLRSETGNYFETGPGFSREDSVEMNSQLNKETPSKHGFGRSSTSIGFSSKFDEPSNPEPIPLFRGRMKDRAESAAAGSIGRHSSRRQELSQIFGAAPVHKTEDSIVPLAEFVKHKRCVDFKTLTANEQMIVTHSNSIFKTFSTKLGETIVTMKDPNVDVEELNFSFGNLRRMLEIDVIHLSENSSINSTTFLSAIAYFVPPRGVLVVNRNGPDILEEVSSRLSASMQNLPKHLEFNDIKPGISCAYIYNADDSTTFFRAIVVGKSGDPDKDVMVMLTDTTVKYLSDVCIRDLYVLPSAVSFEAIPPNVMFGTIFGVESIDQTGQEMLDSILKENSERDEVPAYFYREGKTSIPQFDFLCADRNNRVKWMSSLLLKDGAKPSINKDYMKESIDKEELFSECDQPELIRFVCTNREKVQSWTEPDEKEVVEILEEKSFRDNSATDLAIVNPETPVESKVQFEMRALDVPALFKKFVAERNMLQITNLVNLVDGLSAEGDMWRRLKREMRSTIEDEFGMII